MGLADRACGCFDGLWADRDSSVACLGPERLWPHQVPGPMGTGSYFREDKRPGREAHRSPSSNAETAIPAPHVCLFNEVHTLA